MIAEPLSLFPPHTHPLTLVSDPDGLLADETFLAALNERGFTLLTESDPVLLRNRIESLIPWQVEKPVIVITSAALEALPYDLWQSGHRLQLSLHDYFPNLSYPLVQALTPYQRARLNDCPPPQTRLGQQLSAEYILRHVFNLSLEHLDRLSVLVARSARMFCTMDCNVSDRRPCSAAVRMISRTTNGFLAASLLLDIANCVLHFSRAGL